MCSDNETSGPGKRNELQGDRRGAIRDNKLRQMADNLERAEMVSVGSSCTSDELWRNTWTGLVLHLFKQCLVVPRKLEAGFFVWIMIITCYISKQRMLQPSVHQPLQPR